MAGIHDFLPIQGSQNKISRNDELKKATAKNKEPGGDKSLAAAPGSRKDQARISDTARNLLSLRLDAKRYLKETKQGETLSEKEIARLKEKIEDNDYVNDDVVDKIVDKLTDLPNFLNIRSNI